MGKMDWSVLGKLFGRDKYGVVVWRGPGSWLFTVRQKKRSTGTRGYRDWLGGKLENSRSLYESREQLFLAMVGV